MNLNSLNKPDFSTWLNTIDTLVENLKEYDTADHSYYTDERLLQMFFACYEHVLPRDQYLFDDLVRAHQKHEITWATLKTRSYDAALKSFVHDRTILAATVLPHEEPPPTVKVMYAKNHDTNASHTTKKQRFKSVSSTSPSTSKQTRGPPELKSPVIDWDPSQPCAIHCVKPGARVTHTNANCALQTKARGANKTTQELLLALNDIKASSDDRAAQRKSHTSSAPPPPTASTTRRLASVAVVIPNRDTDDAERNADHLHLSAELSSSSDDEINPRKRPLDDDCTTHTISHHAIASSRHESPTHTHALLHSDDDDADGTDSSEGSDFHPCEVRPDPIDYIDRHDFIERTEAAIKKAESRARSNADRKKRTVAQKEFLLKSFSRVVNTDNGEQVLYKEKTAAQWAEHLVSILIARTGGLNINRVIDDVELAYAAEYRFMTHRREQPPIRRYFSRCGLLPVHIEHLSKKAKRKFTDVWKVTPLPYSPPTNTNILSTSHSVSNTIETPESIGESRCAPSSTNRRSSSVEEFSNIHPLVLHP